MIKRLLVVFIIAVTSIISAQQGTASPYSFYGLGSLKFQGTVENRSMGGMGVYLDSIHVNLRNPAAYAGNNLESYPFSNESRPVKFAVAGAFSETRLQGNSGEARTGTATFDYIALSFPVGKFGFGFGLLPFTSVGYKLDDINSGGNIVNRFEGDGGLNRVFFGMGYQLTKELSVGFDFNYNFGNVENSGIEFAYTPEGDLVQFQTRERNRSELRGSSLNFGVAYKTMITDKLELSATATYSPGTDLSSENERELATVVVDQLTNVEAQVISEDINLGALEKTELTLPSQLSFGAGIGQPKSWFVGAEYRYQNTSDFSNPIFANQTTAFENASEISVGGFFIPNYNAFSGYFKRIVYRAGFNYSNTGLVIKGEQINEFGMSFGLGLPVGNRSLFSNVNLGFEYGQRGTTSQNLIQENFINFNVSLSLNSRWFKKREYN